MKQKPKEPAFEPMAGTTLSVSRHGQVLGEVWRCQRGEGWNYRVTTLVQNKEFKTAKSLNDALHAVYASQAYEYKRLVAAFATAESGAQ